MGSSHSDNQEQYFRKSDWQLSTMNQFSKIWQNRRDPTQKIQQFTLYSSSQQQFNRQKQMYYLRKNHPHIVSAIFLNSQSTSEFCSSSYQQKLYIERIPIRLSDIQHIPFPDYLHLYNQSLKGFSELAYHVGFFAVQEEFIGINEQGLAKIWMNPDYSNTQIIGGKITQEAMVRSIIDIIDRNADYAKDFSSVKDYIYQQKDKIFFQQAIARFNDYVKYHCSGVIPQKLQCIDRVGGIFAISNRMVSPAKTVLYDQKSNMVQIPPQNTIYVNQNRPQLVDSAVLNNQYQIPKMQPQSVVNYQSFSNRLSEGNRSRPYIPPMNQQNLVNVRQTAATFHNYGSNRPPINSFVQRPPNQNISEGRLQSRVVFVPTPTKQIRINTQTSPRASQYQNIVESKIQQQVVNTSQMDKNLNNPNPIINYNSVPQPQIIQKSPQQQQQQIFQQSNQIIARPASDFPNNNSKPINFQQKYQKLDLQQVKTYKQSSNQFAKRPLIFEQQKQIIVSKSNQFDSGIRNIGSPKANRQSNQLLINSNAVSKNVSLYQSPNIKDSNPSYSAINEKPYNIESLYPSYNFNKSYLNNYAEEKSEFKSVNIDDGKSSSDFFTKLNQLGTLGETNSYQNYKYQSKPYPTFEQQNSIKEAKQSYNNPFANQTNNKQLVSYTQINYSNQLYGKPEQINSQEQFGRNAVSNIFNNQKTFQSNSFGQLTEPLKFQNNLDMKYSIFKSEQKKTSSYVEPTYGNYAYRSYEANFDPDLLADIKGLKE